MLDSLFLLPSSWLLVMALGFGLIVGSFLNVVIYRFHTGKSLSGHSHCLSCAEPLAWYDLFPVLSYLYLRGRCRHCGCHFTARYLGVELLTGLLFVLGVQMVNDVYALLLLWAALSVMVVILVYDLRHYIIPDSLTILLTVLVTSFQVLPVLQNEVLSFEILLMNATAAVLASGFLFLLWFVSKGQWIGFGDVKLAFPLALLVGADLVFSFVVWSFWIGAGISVLLVVLSKINRGKLRLPFTSGSLTIKSVVPFAPFLIAGSLLVYFTQLNVLSLFSTFA